MTTPACPICAAAMSEAFTARLLRRHPVRFFRCGDCGLLQSEAPYWLDEAYADPIAEADTGLLQRNLAIAARLATLLYFAFDARCAYLDLAGGYGTLVRLMRDLGFDFYWQDPYCQNLLARGFEHERSGRSYAALTAFEVLEHVHDPLAFLSTALETHGVRSLILSTQTYAGDRAPAQDWWYYAFNAGQHISFYQQQTLARMAQRLNLNFYSWHGLHVLTDQRLSRGKLNLLTGALAYPLAVYARLRLGSRTQSDHAALLRAGGGC